MFAAASAIDVSWARKFWNYVDSELRVNGLESQIRAVLTGQGYVGEGTLSAPRVEELKKILKHLQESGGPAHGSGGELLLAQPMQIGNLHNSEAVKWHTQLPSDQQRAAPEIYRNMRASGASSTRDWLSQMVPQQARDNVHFVDLWSAATAIDFRLGQESTDQGLMHALATEDSLEISLRRLASYVYLRRSGDKSGALHMLAVKPPGSSVDIAPEWLVSSATTHSKVEYQREERVKTTNKQQASDKGGPKGGGGGKDPKGKGKGGGGGRKGGRGGGGAPPATQG
jgi:hypothetical protein